MDPGCLTVSQDQGGRQKGQGMNVLVIDGYNLIRRVSALAEVERRGGLEQGRAELERRLAGYLAGRKGLRAVVVYDGPDPGRTAGGPGLELVFAPDADSRVRELARAQAGQGRPVRVVSSDNALRAQLAGTPRVELVSAEEFWRSHLSGRGSAGEGKSREPKAAAGGAREKPTRVPRGELGLWLEAFGAGEQGRSQRQSPEREQGQAPGREEPPSASEQEQQEHRKALRKERHLRRQKPKT